MKCSCGWRDTDTQKNWDACQRCGDTCVQYVDGSREWIPSVAKRVVTQAVDQMAGHFGSLHQATWRLERKLAKLTRKPRGVAPVPGYSPSTWRMF